MTTHTITLHRTHTLLKLTYKKGMLCKIEVKKGTLNSQQYLQLGTILPPQDEDIERFQEQWRGNVSYNKDDHQPANLYTQFLDEWFGFYNKQFGIFPKFTGADGKSLKQIISYLRQNASDEQEALATWQYLLQHWGQLDEFHQRNTDLKYINSQLNKILQNAKRGNSKGGVGVSDSFKREVLSGLFPK